jgi:hypothetical protein
MALAARHITAGTMTFTHLLMARLSCVHSMPLSFIKGVELGTDIVPAHVMYHVKNY